VSSHSWVTCAWSRIRRCGEGTNCGLSSGYGGVGAWTGGGWCRWRSRRSLARGSSSQCKSAGSCQQRMDCVAVHSKSCQVASHCSSRRGSQFDLISFSLPLPLPLPLPAEVKCARIPVSFDVIRTPLHLAERGGKLVGIVQTRQDKISADWLKHGAKFSLASSRPSRCQVAASAVQRCSLSRCFDTAEIPLRCAAQALTSRQCKDRQASAKTDRLACLSCYSLPSASCDREPTRDAPTANCTRLVRKSSPDPEASPHTNMCFACGPFVVSIGATATRRPGPDLQCQAASETNLACRAYHLTLVRSTLDSNLLKVGERRRTPVRVGTVGPLDHSAMALCLARRELWEATLLPAS
jgi:hypothetical protein